MSSQNSSFYPTLMMSLGLMVAFGVGFYLSSHSATAYPTTTIATGANPVVSEGGAFNDDGTQDLFTAYGGTDVIITDVVFSMSLDNTNTCLISFVGSFILSSGAKVGEMAVGMNNPSWGAGNLAPLSSAHLSSGIRIPAGETLTLHMNRRYKTGCGDAQVHYIISGYQAAI